MGKPGAWPSGPASFCQPVAYVHLLRGSEATAKNERGPHSSRLLLPTHARSFCLRKLGSYAAAAQDFSRLLELGHATTRAFNSRAYCHASLGRYAEAVADYTEALKVGTWPALHGRLDGSGLFTQHSACCAASLRAWAVCAQALTH